MKAPWVRCDHLFRQFEYQYFIQRINYKKLKYYYDKANYTAMKET